MANLVVNDSRSDTTEAAALVYCRSTFCSAMPRYCHGAKGTEGKARMVRRERGFPCI